VTHGYLLTDHPQQKEISVPWILTYCFASIDLWDFNIGPAKTILVEATFPLRIPV
jgi:hypothetical protein